GKGLERRGPKLVSDPPALLVERPAGGTARDVACDRVAVHLRERPVEPLREQRPGPVASARRHTRHTDLDDETAARLEETGVRIDGDPEDDQHEAQREEQPGGGSRVVPLVARRVPHALREDPDAEERAHRLRTPPLPTGAGTGPRARVVRRRK